MVALYARVSTQEQAKEGYSIEEQIERLKKYCEAHGRNDYKIYVDAGYSGATINRPDLRRIIEDVKKGKLEKVIVYKLDRLSRSQKDTLELIEDVFLSHGVDFESMSEKFDTSTSFGRAMVGILAVFAQLEREQIKERMIMGREGRAKEGFFHGGGKKPIGYDYVEGCLIINEYEAMQVRECFELFLSGVNIAKIEKIFEEKGYKHEYGSWNLKRIKSALTNDIYIGYIDFQGNRYKGQHQPIVDAETFEKVQKIIKARDENYSGKGVKQSRSYLGGLIKCKQCGGRYGLSHTYHKDKTYLYYSCYSRRKQNKKLIVDPNCKNKIYKTEVLDGIIFEEIKKLESDPAYAVQLQNANMMSNKGKSKAELLRVEIEKLDTQKARFMKLYGVGDFTAEELQEQIRPLREQKEKLQAEVDALEAAEARMDVEEVREVVKNFSDILDRGIFEEIRLVIESLINYIEIDGENIKIFWKFS